MQSIGQGRKKLLKCALLFALLFTAGATAHANISVNPNPMNFGSQAVGVASPSMAVALTNNTRSNIKIVGVALSVIQFVYSGASLPIILQPGQSLMATVTFTPTAAQAYQGTLTFTRANGMTVIGYLSALGIQATAQSPSVTTQPTSQIVTVGQAASFSVTAFGTAPLSYQWQKNGTAISGATSSSYTTPVETTLDTGAQFTVVVSNSAGSATSNVATLTVNPAPVAPSITTQPTRQTITAGQTATFTAAATGSPTPTVQWQVSTDGGVTFSNVSGATSTTLSFTTALSQSGNQYRAVFTNSAGTATTTAATLTVNATPPPSGTVTIQNTNSSLCIDTGGSAGFTALIQSACSTSNTQKFSLTAAPVSGWYYLVSAASNLCWDVSGGSGSAGALIQQYTCVAVSPEYYQLKAVSGGYEILSANMTNGCLDVVGASTASGANIEQSACIGSANQIFNIVSSALLNTPTITTQPANQTVTAGQTATFSVTASGTAPLSYQWRKNGMTVSGATLSSYTTPAETIADNGSQITVAVSNSVGTGTSNAATLTVNAATYLLGANPTSLSFGNVNTGASSTLPVTLTNSGNSNVAISNVSISGAGFSATGVSTGLIVTPGQTATLNVTFAPAAAGNVTGAGVSVFSNASNSPATIALSGTGVAPTPPTVAINSPTNGATVSGTITVSGTASDNVGVSTVQVQVDGGTFSTASGTTSWTFSLNTGSLSNAAHTITARATNTSGLTATTAVTVNVSNSGSTINVMNFGATGNGATDDTTAIHNAIAALTSGATLFFPCGTYKTTSQLTINISNVTVDGGSCAIIHNTASGSAGIMVVGGSGNGNPNYGPTIALSATANELDTSFTTVSSLGVSAGDYVYLQEGGKDSSTGSGDTGCDVFSCRGEVVKVASVSGNTITVTTALHDIYNPSVNAATAQKILGPLTGVTVTNITFDGSGSNVYGFEVAGVGDSTVSGVTSRNTQGAAILSRGAFNVAWNNITVTGAGSAQCGAAVHLLYQGNLSVNGMSISNENPGAPNTGCLANGAFGFGLGESANGTFTNLTVDASGADGRPFKTAASRWNTFNSLTVKNGVQAYNGMSLEYYSSHNTFNSCVVTNNGAGTGTGTGNAGINTFGNFNQYNAFNNCTISGNGNVQFYISGFDALRLAQDSHNTLNGGSLTGSNSAEAVILIEGDGTYITGAMINGPGPQGIYLDVQASNACVNNNTFTPGSGLGAAISANGSGDLGLGNILNSLGNNLTAGICAPPLP